MPTNSLDAREGSAPATLAHPPVDQRRALVHRIVASRHFSKAHQLRDILLYLVDRAILDPSVAIHEHEIACTVLGRKADFNPHEDNIVRVQISHLRKRLDDYFAFEGLTETLRVSVPKGGYSPRFDVSSPQPGTLACETIPPTSPETAEPRKSNARGRRIPVLTFVVLMAGIAVGTYIWQHHVSSRDVQPGSSATALTRDDLLWPLLFNARSTNIVVADTCLVMLQDILHTDIALSEYLDGRYPGNLLEKVPDQGLQKALRLISTRQYTSLADLNSAQRLSELSHRYSAIVPAVRYARHINIRDFKTGNFILVGSRRGIPWVRLFEPQLNFSMEEDGSTNRYYYRNKSPRPGEPKAWYQEAGQDGTIDTYANVALVPNLGNEGFVLILSGIGMEASEAAGEFVAGAEFRKELSRILPLIASRPQLRYFELLLRTRAVAGAARSSQVVASRLFANPVPALPQ